MLLLKGVGIGGCFLYNIKQKLSGVVGILSEIKVVMCLPGACCCCEQFLLVWDGPAAGRVLDIPDQTNMLVRLGAIVTVGSACPRLPDTLLIPRETSAGLQAGV